MSQNTATTPEQLQAALRFTLDDLYDNQSGQLSEVQAYYLRVRRQRSVLIGVAIAVVFAFIATLFLYNATPLRVLIGIGVTLCNAAMLGIFGRYWMRLTGDIRAGTVQAHSGTLERIIKPITRRVLNYILRIHDVDVYVPKDTFDLFEHHATYTLYRTPYTGTLLSAEKHIS
jgi:hypothetical protein